MKKGLLATLLVATGAAIAVYIIKEEQSNHEDAKEEKKVIKLRSKEESEELVKAIQEIEDLPNQVSNDNENLVSDAHSFKPLNIEHQTKGFGIVADLEDTEETPLEVVAEPFMMEEEVPEEISVEAEDEDQFIDFPNFVPFESIDETDSLPDLEDILPNEVEEEFQEIDLPSFIKSNAQVDEPLNTLYEEPTVQYHEVVDSIHDTSEISLNDLDDGDLQKLFATTDDNTYEPQTEEIAPSSIPSFDNTTEINLGEFDEDEIRKLFAMDDDEDIEEIELPNDFNTNVEGVFQPFMDEDLEEIVLDDHDDEIKRELTLDEFEEFKQRLTHIGDDDIDLINLNDSKPFEAHDGHVAEEVDIINFGNVVSDETVNLDDFVFEELPTDKIENNEPVELEEISIDEIEPLEEIKLDEGEYPETVHEIGKLYPYLNHKFINAIFSHFDEFAEEFMPGTSCKITHKVQFPESQNLMDFISIIKNYGYEIMGTDDDHNILLSLTFINEESKILSEIYNISNQVNYLDGLYRGYELEHND